MIIYKDIIVTPSELVSDSFKLEKKGDCVYEVDCKSITKTDQNDFDIGANASTEDAAEDLEAGSRAVIDVVDAFQLVNIGPMPNMAPKEAGKKEESEYFQLYLKPYIKKIVKRAPEYAKELAKNHQFPAEEVAGVEEAAKVFPNNAGKWYKKEILPKLKDYEWYRGADDVDLQGMLVGLNYREDGITPYLTFWTLGVWPHKV